MASAETLASLEDAVLWSYRLLLGREPENVEVVQAHARAHPTVADIRRHFISTEEFAQSIIGARIAASEIANRTAEAEVFGHFPPWTGVEEPGFWRDFLGVRTRCEYLPRAYDVLSGTVEGPPGAEKLGLHEIPEWIGSLRSVLEARSRGALVVIELGAGWGPWLVGATRAAACVGIHDVRLVGVEGEPSHFAFMRQHFRDNGLDPDAHVLIHGVVGPHDGVARFPKSPDPRSDYGQVADYDAEPTANGTFEVVRCVALTTLLDQLPPVDLIHSDVQGAEYDVLSAAQEGLDARVRRVVVGTQSRRIEADLLNLFAAMGWQLEHETPCALNQIENGFQLARNGCQVWANPRRDVLS